MENTNLVCVNCGLTSSKATKEQIEDALTGKITCPMCGSKVETSVVCWGCMDSFIVVGCPKHDPVEVKGI